VRHRLTTRSRQAITLIELLLVLALLVIIGAMALPAFEGPMENQRLRKSGDLIRATWAKARVQAMKTGQVQMFRFELGSSKYEVAPWLSQDANVESSVLGQQLESQQSGSAGPSPLPPPQLEDLHENIIFTRITTPGNPRQELTEQAIAADSQYDQNALAAEWAPPILFYPDGTSSDARIYLGNRRTNSFVMVQLRGMTGVALMTDLLTEEEASQ
jgi:type II secretory pathway pseudopilin PulG